jgi:signal transduction histidine kinase
MNMSNAETIVPLVSAAAYCVLFAVALLRVGWQERLARWLLSFVAASFLWQLFQLPFPLAETFPNLATTILLVNTLLLGMLTAAYIYWSHRRTWLLIGGLAVLVVMVANLASAVDTAQGAGAGLTVSHLPSLIVWFGLSLTLLIAAWRNYQRARLPGHANRLLYWAVILFVTFAGEALLLFSDSSALAVTGQTTRFIGAVGMAYAAADYRLFDVRTRVLRFLAIFVIFLASAGLATAILFLVQQLTRNMPQGSGTIVLIAVVALGFLVYQPFYRLIEGFLYRFMLGQEYKTSTVLRNYSQAIARTLDVEQLSLVIVGTINNLLETNRGALMLLSRENDGYVLEPIPAIGYVFTHKVHLNGDSLLVRALQNEGKPLLQYEIDFNPRLQGITNEERGWLSELAMDVYVPINTDKELTGLIALGPKSSGLTYRPNELELLQVLADQTVVALQNARLYTELGAQNERIRLLNADLRQQNRRLEIMDRVKTDFITIASHELRTPLTQVKGYADILEAMNDEDSLTQDQTREIVSHINRATRQLEQLISAMLDASQLDVDGMKLQFAQTRIEAVLRLAAEPMAGAMRERRIGLKLVNMHELPPIVADFQRLVQAFHNLIGNALKYTPDGGGITVTAEVAESSDNKQYLEVIVSDSGIGIDPQYHELIFEKFFRVGNPQLHSTGTTKFKGAGPGLGLSIAKGVIEAHGGRIWVESSGEDEVSFPGSRFHVILPVVPPDAEAVVPSQLERRPEPFLR